MEQTTAIRTLAASMAALARVVKCELSRIGIETSTHNVLEAIEAQSLSVFTSFGGDLAADSGDG